MPDPRVVLQCEALVVERDDTRYRVVTPDGSTVHDSLGEALRSIAGLMDETEGWDGLSLGLPVDELLIAAEAGGLDLLFPWSGCGFAKINGHWLPAAGLREFDGEPGATFDLVDTYGDLGVTADLYRYGEVFLVDWSDAEFENRGFEVLGTITEDEAHRIAGECP